ncbi:hypothetical protein DFP72DRAFT_936005 [Ephemerocybe angulata]|uniref:F-box domain-containing protein n=1 Tax=Ephemerocybe angulata TaxID=980116 RepID=A0A8H6LW28_9AGAR|nr:hypothetical protein DFP72DRAFT_936005 [Tulosesus angulatus]
MSSAPFESQIELDREIVRLEQQLLDLKRRRNAMSPISRIPPELLSNIFFLALCFLEADGVTPHKLDPNVTKQAICAVSHHWRETSFTDPKLWMEIHVRDSTTTKYLDLVGKNLRENQEVYLEAHDIVKNSSALRHIFLHVLKVEKTRLKRVVISARYSYIFREILRESSLWEDTVTLDLVFYRGSPFGKIDVTGQDIAAVFPHIRELRLATMPGFPRDLLHFLNITDLYLIVYIVDDIHQVFEILKSAERLVSFKLVVQHTRHAFELEGVLPSAEVELSRLKRFELDTRDTPLLLALLQPLRFRGNMERVFITTCDTRRKELSHLVIPAIILAFPETSAPETVKVMRVSVNSAEDEPSFVGYEMGWIARQGHRLTVVLPVLQNDNPSSVLAPEIRPLSTLPFMDPNSWILNNVQDIEVGTRPTLPFWECIARIPTLRRLTITAWDIDDCFLRILRGDVERPGNVRDQDLEVPMPFPALRSIKVNTETLSTSGLDVDYARALGQALEARAAGAGEEKVGKIRKLEFRSCMSELGEETRGILLSVALCVRWKMKN